MKKIAYMITCYKNPKSLHNLISSLNDERVDFYIHVDKKCDITDFKNLLKKYNNVFFLENNNRVKIYWGGYSQVQSQYNLIKKILNSGINYKKIVNLTGQDFPLKDNNKIINEICDDREYITCFMLNKDPNQYNKIKYYHLMDSNKFVRKIIDKLKIKKKVSYDYYFGSEYWALSRIVLKDIINLYDNLPKLKKELKHSFAPSEIWIHTLFMMTKYWKDNNVYTKEYNGLIELSPLEYFEYTDKIKILDIQDYDKLIKSNKLFARKFDEKISSELILHLKKFR